MKLSKNAVLWAIAALSIFLFFYQTGILLVWKASPALSRLPTLAGVALFAVLYSALLYGLVIELHRRQDKDARAESFALGARDLVFALVSLTVTLAAWGVWVWPDLDRTVDTFGDEDHHFERTIQTQEFLRKWGTGTPPSVPHESFYRYSGLMYLLFALFSNDLWGTTASPVFHRLGLLLPHLGLVIAVFAAVGAFLKNHILAFLFSVLVGISPLLLTYTCNKYLDIGHPLLFFLGCVALYRGIVLGSARSQLMAALMAGLMSLVRENSMPTTVLFGGVLAWQHLRGPHRRWQWAFLLLATAVFPFACFYAFKMNVVQVYLKGVMDHHRLRPYHLFQQDYALFVAAGALYATPCLYFFAGASFFRSRDKMHRVARGVILASLAAQLVIYGLFQPGWMPWTRNYLMFYGQLLALALFGTAYLLSLGARARKWVLGTLAACIALEAGLSAACLRTNTLFHETEVRYAYDSLFEFLLRQNEIPRGATIYLSVPIERPYSFEFARKTVEQTTGSRLPFEFKDLSVSGQPSSWDNFTPFALFQEHLPSSARHILFHWRIPGTLMPVLRRMPCVSRPTAAELDGFRILLELPDPWSNGRSGMILLTRGASTVDPVVPISIPAGLLHDSPDSLEKVVLKLIGEVKMEFVRIKAGEFLMGSQDREEDERPVHPVTITRDFWMQTTETTQEQWEAVMRKNPSYFKGADLPVETVSWRECQEFVMKLNEKLALHSFSEGGVKELLNGKKVARLPTEAEWEYACRAGENGKWSFGDDEKNLGEFAWYEKNSEDRTHPVGKKRPNAWGLYDMHGNVWEWCEDWYGPYPSEAATDPTGPVKSNYQCLRGGSWYNIDSKTRSADRVRVNFPACVNSANGLRVALR